MHPATSFQCVKNSSQFNKDFLKSYNEESDEGYFLEVDVQYLDKLHDLYNDLPFLLERMEIEKVENFVLKNFIELLSLIKMLG